MLLPCTLETMELLLSLNLLIQDFQILQEERVL